MTAAPRTRRGARLAAGLLAAALALCAWTLTAAPAGSHALLESADPADGAVLDEAPDEVVLTFNEPVSVPTGALRVHDGQAEQVEADARSGDDPSVVVVDLPDDLPDDGYLVVYRVVSADDHPVAGVTGFTVGDAAAVDDATTAEVIGGGDGLVGGLAAVLRGLVALAVLVAAGAAGFAALVASGAADRGRAARLGRRAAAVGLVVQAVALPVQAMAVTGSGLAALRPGPLGEVLASSLGQAWLLRTVALAVLLLPGLWRGRAAPAAGVGALGLLAFALDGHQRSVDPQWLLMAGDVVHVVAAATWLAGLWLLVLGLRARRPSTAGAEDAAGLVARFSALALWTVLAVAVSGVAMAWPLVAVPDALVSTAYGWTLLAKVGLVLVAVALAAYNRLRLVPVVRRAAHVGHGGAAAWSRLGTTVRAEAVLLVVVVLLTGWLTGLRPAADAAGASGLYEETVAVSDGLDLQVVVDPNQAGVRNQIHFYLLDETGRPSDEVDDVSLSLTYAPEDIGPFEHDPFPAGPGHYIANVEDLTFAGPWELTVTVPVGDFDEETTTVTVPVR